MAFVEVEVLKCQDLPKLHRLGVQDPYVVVKYAGSERRTPTHNNGGQDPVFNCRVRFQYVPGEDTVRIRIFNERSREDEYIAGTKVNFAAGLEVGYVEARVPTIDGNGRQKGEIELAIHCPQIRRQKEPEPAAAAAVAAVAAAATVEAIKLDDSKITYDQALSEARAVHYAGVAGAMVPHRAVAGAMAESLVENFNAIKEDDLAEMEGVFKDARKRVESLLEDALKEWMELGAGYRKSVVDVVAENDPGAKERFQKQLEKFSSGMLARGQASQGAFRDINAALLGGMSSLLSKYTEDLNQLSDGIVLGFTKSLEQYKEDVEDSLKEEAEKRSREDAAKVAPPPPAPATPPPPSEPVAPRPVAVAATPVRVAPAAPPPQAAAQGPPPPQYHAPPPSQYAAAPPPHYAPPPAGYYPPPPQGYAQAPPPPPQRSAADEERARQEAYASQMRMQEAQRAAEEERRKQEQKERMVKAAVLVHHHRAVRRRGMMLGAAIAN